MAQKKVTKASPIKLLNANHFTKLLTFQRCSFTLHVIPYSGRIGREKWPGIDCLHMHGHFHYFHV